MIHVIPDIAQDEAPPVLGGEKVMAQDIIAMDREASSRTIDEDGHLHVADAPISKACVSPYLGREIVDNEKLGLDPTKIYRMLRDPESLEKSADTFNGKPILNVHKPQTANDHSHNLTVGSLSEVYWDAPYLRAKDLTVWDGDSISKVQNGEQRQLSAAYRYDADMTPGTYNGERYDGRMVNIRGNHVALVPKGRAGPDVVIGDALPTGLNINFTKEPDVMAKKPILSRKAALAKGALSLHLAPKMAADATLDFNTILAGVTAKNFKSQKAAIADRIRLATTGKLAQDADLSDVADLLTAIENLDGGPDDKAPDPKVINDDDETDPDQDPADMGAMDDVDHAALMDFLKGKLSPEDHARACKMVGVEPSPTSPSDKEPTAEDDKTMPGKPATGEPPMTKTAMDAAIADAVLKAEKNTIARLKGVREAERLVRPYIGELSMGMDSAEDVFRYALGKLGVKHEAVKDVAALPILLQAQPIPGSNRPSTAFRPKVAQDAAGSDAFSKMFPDANRLVS
jgi:hypothetical protein